METNHLMAAAFRGYVSGEAGTGYRRHYTENAAGAVKGTFVIDNEEQAKQFCEDHGYEGRDEKGFIWDLDYGEG